MSCGLGAIILVFMLVKYNVGNASLEAELLQEDLKKLEAEASGLRANVANAKAQEASVAAQIEGVSSQISSSNDAANQAQAEAAQILESKKSLEEGIKSFEVPKPPDIIEKPRVGEEEYLIGLKVEGRRIAILIDSSSSMTDENLIDIIRRKNTSTKQNGPKWRRTVAIAEWLMTRVPRQSSVSLITFSANAESHTRNTLIPGRDVTGMNQALASMRKVIPEGATNLEAGLEMAAKVTPTDLYIVTDGLPTSGTSSYKSLNPFADCNALWGGSTTISGACRVKLFRHTAAKTKLKNVNINVILLPIEGDPQAANEYWQWTAANSGLLISPAASWP